METKLKHDREERFEKFVKFEYDIYDKRSRQWKYDVDTGKIYIGGVSMGFASLLFIPGIICLFVATPVGIGIMAVVAVLFTYSSKKEDKAVEEWRTKHGFRIEDCEKRHEEFATNMRNEISSKEKELKNELDRINQTLAKYEKY